LLTRHSHGVCVKSLREYLSDFCTRQSDLSSQKALPATL
jgi:hypothetical protein